MSMHLHFIEDESGDVVDQLEFCSADCHRDYVVDQNKCHLYGDNYGGWNGGHESEFGTTCHNCGAVILGSCGPISE